MNDLKTLPKAHLHLHLEAGMSPALLQFLLIDGDLQGAVCGHWRFGPYDVDDIVVYLPEEERASRRDEIIEAVAWKYHPPEHNILRYNGEPAGERPPSAECD